MINIDKLTKCYGKIKAVDKISLNVGKGESFALLGSNGAGKTTTIKMLAGLMMPTEGRVNINNMDVIKHQFEIKKITGYLPENDALYKYLTPREFLSFIGKIRGMPDDLIHERSKKFISIFRLESCADRLIIGLSKGNQRKVAVIASFLHYPELLLLDEPTSNLDPEIIVAFKECLEEFKKQGMTMFICTHILNFVEKTCDKIGIISEGKILEEEYISQLYIKHSSKSLEEIYLQILRQSR